MFISYNIEHHTLFYRFPGVFQATHHHLSQKEEELHWKPHAMVTMFLNPTWSRLNPFRTFSKAVLKSPHSETLDSTLWAKKVKLTDSKIMTLTFPRLRWINNKNVTNCSDGDPLQQILCLVVETLIDTKPRSWFVCLAIHTTHQTVPSVTKTQHLENVSKWETEPTQC